MPCTARRRWPSPRHDPTDDDAVFATVPERVDHLVQTPASQATISPMPMLNARNISSSAIPPRSAMKLNTGGIGQAPSIDLGSATSAEACAEDFP